MTPRSRCCSWSDETLILMFGSHFLNAGMLIAGITLLVSVGWVSAAAQGLNTTPPGIDERAELGSLRKRAEQGDARAAYLVGRSYMMGTGVPRDYREAAKWCQQAAAQNLADAQVLLGFLYEHGDGVERDYKTAFSYYMAAAKQGHATAQNNLAIMYELGHGTKRSVDEAEHWYRAAAEHFFIVAQCNLASLEFRQKDYLQAAHWFREAAQHGSATAQEDLAWMYYTGTGVPPDYSEAAKWVRLAADQGVARAQLDLGFLYEKGKGVPLDYVSAFAWYKAAEDGGQKRASTQLKSLSLVMTREQITAATGKAATVPRLPSEIDETESSIGRPFGDIPMNRADVLGQTQPSREATNKKHH